MQGDRIQELSRFDYGSVETLAQGCVGFLLTCGFRRRVRHPLIDVHTRSILGLFDDYPIAHREKSATKEGIAALTDCIAALKEGDADREGDCKFSIIKLACKGLVLLRWERGSAPHAQPRPTHVVAELIKSVQQKEQQPLRCAWYSPCMQAYDTMHAPLQCLCNSELKVAHACRHVQRVIPVEGMCELEEDVLQKAIARLASEHVAGTPVISNGKAADVAAASTGQAGKPEEGAEELPALRFAVAWRSRYAEGGSAECTVQSSAADTSAAEGAAAAPPDTNGHVAGHKDPAEGAENDLSAGLDSKTAPAVVQTTSLPPSSRSMGRDRAIKAAAAGFVEGTAGVRQATVDLGKPDVVVIVEGVPVGRRMLCALSIVSADIVTQNTKLNILPIGGS